MPVTVINGPVIAAGESLSDALDCTSGQIVRITTPYEWTPANLSFQVSSDGLGFNDLYAQGREVMIRCGPQWGLIIPAEYVPSLAFLKFRSGTSRWPVLQEARRQFAVAVLTP